MTERESSAEAAAAASPVEPGAAVPAAATSAVQPVPVPAAPKLFVVHAPEDAWFVDGFLLDALRLPLGEVVTASDPGGAALVTQRMSQIERGAMASVTVVVVSPAFLASGWAQFAGRIAAYESVEAAGDGRATLIPALLAECELPLQLRFRVALDFRTQDRAHWEAQAGRLRDQLAAPPPVIVPLACPYPGIRPFTTEDAARFHGRDQEVAELLGRLGTGQREVYVIGPSGSGKSSLVAAGLVPSVRQSPARAGGAFVDRSMRPGADPTAALAALVEATPAERGDASLRWLGGAVGRVLAGQPDHRLLIVVDQLEELFTTAPAEARAGFVAALRALRGDARVALVLALRADCYALLMESALWADLDGRLSRLDVGPLRGDKLREAIEAPARALGVYFEPVLIERLLRDVADEPGALPLLQATLVELWQQRTRGLLRLAEYTAMSDGARTGLAVTVARRADAALDELSPGRREIARRVLLRLVQFGDGAGASRRQATRAALATAGDAPVEIDAVVRHLADRRLITTSGGDDADPEARIDLAHEILLTAWPALGDWIRSRRHDEQRRRALEARAAEWVSRGRGGSRLLDADELRDVRGWLTGDKARDLGVSEDIQQLIARSEAELAAQQAELEARRRRWRRWVTAALAVLTVAVVAVSTLAVIARRRSQEASAEAAVAEAQSREARRQAAVAEAQSREALRQLARNDLAQGQALVMADQPAQAAPYLVAARDGGIDGVAIRTLFRRAAQGIPRVVLAHPGPVSAVAWSPDGSRLVTAHRDLHHATYAAEVWDARSGAALARLGHGAPITAVAWSPDGARVATASNDRTAQVWDARSGQPAAPPLAHDQPVGMVVWSPDGTRVATASETTARVWDARSGQPVTPPLAHRLAITALVWSPDGTRVATASYDGTARVWDAASGRAVTTLVAQRAGVAGVAWNPDGTRLVTVSSDGGAQIWDAASGQAVTPPLAPRSRIAAAKWSPDGTRVATASSDGTARVWDAGSGAAVTPPLAHDRAVGALAWSPDGTRVATVCEDHTARVWDAASGQPVTPPLAHQDVIVALRWSPDGTRVATASSDETVRIWDAGSGAAVMPPLAHLAGLVTLAWSPDGTWLATASYDGTARIWDARARPAVAIEHDDAVGAVAWSPDGRRVATASNDGTARVWDAASGRAVTPPLRHQARVTAVAWSPDGRRVATASDDATARVWDAASGAAVTPPLASPARVTAVAWRPDGARLATQGDDGTVRIWDAASGEAPVPAIELGDRCSALAWSPDGGRLATASYYLVQVWDAASGHEVARPLEHGDVVYALAWSPDGARLATGGRDGTARIWDPAAGQAVMPPLVHQGPVMAVAWSPDGTRLATASNDQTARVWDARTGQAVTRSLGHRDVVGAVAWSPDGTRVATASDDQTARVWDARTGQALSPPLEHGAEVQAVAWSPDGTRLATASRDGTARLWDVAWDTGTLADWRAVIERCDYALNRDGVLITRAPPAARGSPPAIPSSPAAGSSRP